MSEKYVFPQNAGSSEYKKKLILIAELGLDPFAREYVSDPRFDTKIILYENKHWFVFKNQHQYPDIEHQFMFIYQEYAETFLDLPSEAAADLWELAAKVCKDYNILGGGLSLRFGIPEKSGATVRHLHAQLIVPKDGKRTAAWYGTKPEE